MFSLQKLDKIIKTNEAVLKNQMETLQKKVTDGLLHLIEQILNCNTRADMDKLKKTALETKVKFDRISGR